MWPFVIISITYLLFTTTDGAVRMLVLLHAYNKGFTAMEVAIMFTLYELMGAVTNLAAGVAGAKWGIRATLITGLTLQIGGLAMLYGWSDEWSKSEAVVYVTAAQALCGKGLFEFLRDPGGQLQKMESCWFFFWFWFPVHACATHAYSVIITRTPTRRM